MPSRSAIRKGGLSALPRVHPPPIVHMQPRHLRGAFVATPPCEDALATGNAHLGAGFALRCVQRFSSLTGRGYPAAAQAGRPAHQRSSGSGPLVLGASPRNVPPPATDRDRTVSRRSEPSSRAALMGEQPNPWDGLQPQDATSRHRGAKPCRRCELLGKISLLSPG